MRCAYSTAMIPGPLLLLVFCTLVSLSRGSRCTLSILSVLPYPDQNPEFSSSYTDGPDIIPAGYLAIEMINNRSDILSDYQLELVEARGGCGMDTLTLSEKAIVQNVFRGEKHVIGIVGPRCYNSAERVGQLIAKDAIALVNVHMCGSPNLGTLSVYPYSTSTTPCIIRFVDAYVALIIHNQWKQAPVAFLFEDEELSYSILTYLTEKLNGSGVAYSSIVTDNYIHGALTGLEASSARLVLVNIDGILAQKLMCLALTRNAIYPKYHWTFLRTKLNEFTDVDFLYMGVRYSCNSKAFSLALNNSIAFNFSYNPRNSAITDRGISGLTYAEYVEKYTKAVQRYNSGMYGTPAKFASINKLGNAFHDSIWVLALALNATDTKLKRVNQSLCEYGYGQPHLTKLIQEEILGVRFLGAGGEVNYKYNGTRRFPPGIVNLWMYQGIGGYGSLIKLGCFDNLGVLSISLRNATFIRIIQQDRQFRLPLDIVFQIGAIIAFLLTASIHVMNVTFRAQSIVKASSHRLNHIAYVGCYLLIATVVTLSVTETYVFSHAIKAVLCNLMHWMGGIGFTLIYGTINVKLYRIYSLLVVSVRRFQLPSNDNKILSDKNLFLTVIALTIPNIIICIAWSILDPVTIMSIWKINTDTVQPFTVTIESCLTNTSKMPLIWLGLLVGYMCLLSSTVAYSAYLTRSISAQHYKTDNIVILSALLFLSAAIAGPMLVIQHAAYTDPEEAHTLLFITLGLFLIIFVYICVFLLFLPPIFPLLKKRMLRWLKSPISGGDK